MNNRLIRGNTLGSVMAALVIICVLAAVYFIMPKGSASTRADGKGTTTVGAAMYKAKDSSCKHNLSQIRQLLMIQGDTNGDEATYPDTLDGLRGLGAEMRKCTVGKEPYSYDPVTGKVGCPHPGHEKY